MIVRDQRPVKCHVPHTAARIEVAAFAQEIEIIWFVSFHVISLKKNTQG